MFENTSLVTTSSPGPASRSAPFEFVVPTPGPVPATHTAESSPAPFPARVSPVEAPNPSRAQAPPAESSTPAPAPAPKVPPVETHVPVMPRLQTTGLYSSVHIGIVNSLSATFSLALVNSTKKAVARNIALLADIRRRLFNSSIVY
jgi:hypothetical protein